MKCEYVVMYFNFGEWEPKCRRKSYNAAIKARNKYFGKDSGSYPWLFKIEKREIKYET